MNQPFDFDRALQRCAESSSLDEFRRLLRAVPDAHWPVFATRMNADLSLFPADLPFDMSVDTSPFSDSPLRSELLAEAKRSAFEREHQRRIAD